MARADEVEKAARWMALREGEDVVDDSMERYERERHREQKDCDMFCCRFCIWPVYEHWWTVCLAT